MLKVLIVEDNRIFREVFKKGLVDYFPSMVIEEAGNADEALQKIKGGPPHLIFMDIRLPGVNGLQLTPVCPFPLESRRVPNWVDTLL